MTGAAPERQVLAPCAATAVRIPTETASELLLYLQAICGAANHRVPTGAGPF